VGAGICLDVLLWRMVLWLRRSWLQ